MATLPSIEAILLEIRQSLGGSAYKRKKKFAAGEGRLEKHFAMGREVLRDIFDALEMDEDARLSAGRNLMDLANACQVLEMDTWTFDADQRQVLWMLFGYLYIPGLARFVARWTLENRMDANMPGARFWYLPEHRDEDGTEPLYLPVAQLVDWLLDLLGTSLEKFADERSAATDGDHESLRRDLYGWHKDTIPKLGKIRKYFGDDVKLSFRGAFVPDENATPEERFKGALSFVNRKDLTPEKLRSEIPMTSPGRLEAILEERANDDEKAHFVSLLAQRYRPPSPRTIRQYFRVARAAQDGYVRLLEFFFPDVKRLCANTHENKLLQVFRLYKHVYNLTIDAWQQHGDDGEDAENQWFEEQTPPDLAFGPMLSIMPSNRESNIPLLAQILTRHFKGTSPEAPLEDLWPTEHTDPHALAVRNVTRAKAILDEQTAADRLAEHLKSGTPWRKLQAEDHFNVVYRIACQTDLSLRIREAALSRLHEIADDSDKIFQAICVELGNHLNGERTHRTKETQGRVQGLLDKAEATPRHERWSAPLLQYEAKHFLAQNNLPEAGRLFRQALDACKERSFGCFRGEIARDCFALELADQRLIQNNHEVYFREMLRGDMFETDVMPRIEDTARGGFNYFWETLYKPYPGQEVQRPRSESENKELTEAFGQFLMQDDRGALLEWIKKDTERMGKRLRDTEGNSLLLFLIKERTATVKYWRHTDPQLVSRSRDYIGLMIQYGPCDQINLTDFKGQTPLMLMAEAGDTELVALLLGKGAAPDRQDYEGRTALHAAIKSRIDTCVDRLLDHPCCTDKLTIDRRSPLHTAVWSGNVHAVRRLLDVNPKLAWERDAYGDTPLELAECLIDDEEDLNSLTMACRELGLAGATKPVLQEIVAILENVPPPD